MTDVYFSIVLLKFTKVTLDIVGIPSRKMCLKDIEIAPEWVCFAAGSVYTVLRGQREAYEHYLLCIFWSRLKVHK